MKQRSMDILAPEKHTLLLPSKLSWTTHSDFKSGKNYVFLELFVDKFSARLD